VTVAEKALDQLETRVTQAVQLLSGLQREVRTLEEEVQTLKRSLEEVKEDNKLKNQVTYKGKNIAEVLQLTAREAIDFFRASPGLLKKLRILDEVGLGYLRLGQPATTLSGGEAQRIKLASYLSRQTSKQPLFLFDEPTTGLHFDDISKLLRAFDRLISQGATVLVIEHNLDVIKCADWIIDLGPEGGEAGGRLIAEGPPETIAAVKDSYTGQFLGKYLT